MNGVGRVVLPLALLAALTLILIAYLVARLRRRRPPGDDSREYGSTTQTDSYFPLDGGQHHQHHQTSTSEHGHGDGGQHTWTGDSGAAGGHDSGDSGGGGD